MSGSRQIIVNSRVLGSFTNRCSVILPTPLECPKSCDIYATLVDAQIPNTYLNVDARNNTVALTFRYGTLRFDTSYTFPTTGVNYVMSTLASNWNGPAPALPALPGRRFNFTLGGVACSVVVALTVVGQVFNVRFLSTTGVPTGAGPSATWSGIINSTTLGFYNTVFTTAVGPNGVVPALSVRNYLITSTLNTFNQMPIAGYEAPLKILCKVPSTTTFGFIDNFTNPGTSPLKLADRFISGFEIALLDEFGRNLDLRGDSWGCTIQLEYLPRIIDGPDYFEDQE